MKAYKLELLVVDHDEVSQEDIEAAIKDCINCAIMKVESAEIGAWHDDHPLNKFASMKDEYKRIFG